MIEGHSCFNGVDFILVMGIALALLRISLLKDKLRPYQKRRFYQR